MRNPARRALLLLVLTFLPACTGRDAPVGEFAVDTLQGGVVLVSNPEAGAWAGGAGWTAVEDLRIGTSDGDPAYLLGGPIALDVDGLGRLWVLDAMAGELRVFDSRGKHVRTVGRKGRGPGEFEQPIGMARGPDGLLWVVDPANARYSAFDTTGAFRTSRLRRAEGFTMPWPGTVDRQGRLYDVLPVTGAQAVTNHLLRFGKDAKDAEILPLPAFQPELFVAQRGTVTNWAPVPFAPSLVWALAPDGRIWSATTDRYRIHVHEPGGDTVRVIERAFTPVRVAQADVDSARVLLKYFTDQGGEIDLGRVPDTKPPFTSLLFDDRGHAWLRLSLPAGERGTAFDVIDPAGRYLGRVKIPAEILDAVPVVVRGDALYTVVLSDEGVPQVVRYRLRGRDAG